MNSTDLFTITQKALFKLRQKLLDLSRRNRLLNFRETARTIRVVDELPKGTFETLVTESKGMVLIPLPEEDEEEKENKLPDNNQVTLFSQDKNLDQSKNKNEDSEGKPKKSDIDKSFELPSPTGEIKGKHKDLNLQTPFTTRLLERRCKRLLQESRTAIEETGSNLLYLAIGFLEWYEDDSSSTINRAPLILVPIQIERSRIDRKTNCYSYVLSYTEEDIETNISLAEKLSQDFGLILPGLDNEIDPEKYFEEVSKVIVDKKCWRVAREMVIGLFSFSKLLMYKDLDPENWPDKCNITKHMNIQEILAGRETSDQGEEKIYGEEHYIDENSIADKVALILDADSSQHLALIDTLLGNDLVIEGPPGTGKSQTITNLIASSLHDGKSVLFVAEKKAALEVVRRRLDHTGLGDFCLELHSHKTQKGRLHADIKRRLEQNFHDSTNLRYDIEDIVNEREKLRSYVNLINSVVGSSGETIHDIFWKAERWQSDILGNKVNFIVTNSLKLTRKEINDRVNKLEELAQLRKDLSDSAINVWRGYSLKSVLPGDEEKVKSLLSVIEEKTQLHQSYLENIKKESQIPLQFSIGTLRMLTSKNIQVLSKMPESFVEKIALKFLKPEALQILDDLDAAIDEHEKLMDIVKEVFTYKSEMALEHFKQIHNSANTLSSLGFGDLPFHDLNRAINVADHSIHNLIELTSLTDGVREIFAEKPRTIDDFNNFIKLAKHVVKAPEDIDISSHFEHILPYAAILVKKAKQEFQNISQKFHQCSEFFNISHLPEYGEIKNLFLLLQRYSGKRFSFFSSELRKARRKIKEFLVKPKYVKSPEIIDRLEQLAVTVKDKNTAITNTEYLKVLGPLFKGTETDWDRLENHIFWAQSLRQKAGSQKVAAKIIQNIIHYRDVLLQIDKKTSHLLESIIAELEKLNLVEGSNTAVENLTEKIKSIKGELLEAMSCLSGLVVDKEANLEQIKDSAKAFLSDNHLHKTIDKDERFTEFLEGHFKGLHTDTKDFKKIVQWVTSLQTESSLPIEIIEWLLSQDTQNRKAVLTDLLKVNQDYLEEWIRFNEEFGKIGALDIEQFFGKSEQDFTLDLVIKKVSNCLQNINTLVAWSDYCRTVTKARSIGLEEVTRAIDSEDIVADDAIPVYKAALYRSMARELVQNYSELSSFTRANYENTRKRFIELDKKIIEHTRKQVAHEIDKRDIPYGCDYGYVRDYTELALIRHEIKKRKCHIPIRQLVRRSYKALQAIKPCFMMSPMSVAQYLVPGQITFDLVVMDEASQIKPEDALGAIARASQMVVVGDPNQLPPTTFFERINENIEDEEESTAVEDTESILDGCLDKYRTRRLRWHYRSDHESLIAFSNREFYDDNLIVFPSPHNENKFLGVYSHYVEGATYLKGRNLVEAEAVVQSVKNHFQSSPRFSLGVATFNMEQRDLILDILDRLLKQNPWLERAIKKSEDTEEPFFIKNLENVQGDERDVIFISSTYGQDPDAGKVYQRFGPIGGSAGWRRLNVIFSRAKKRVVLFTSMKPTDILIGENTPRGVRALRTYLEYAQHGGFPDYGQATNEDPGSDFEISVSRVLNESGYKTVPQIGVAGFYIDIGVEHPDRKGEFILGIECDGATYHSAKSARDRDRLRQEILEQKHWKIHRIWSTDWFRNREHEIQRLLHTIKEIVEEERSRVKIDDSVSEQKRIQDETAATEYKIPADRVDEDKREDDYLKTSLVQNTDEELRAELLVYKHNRILKRFPDQSKCILRDEMLDCFVSTKPTTMDEFRSKIPLKMREKTDGTQIKFLEDVFEIIEEFAF